jgi:hypothetical protein
MKSILAVVTDKHAGHLLGLCNPNVRLHQIGHDGEIREYTPALTDSQVFLWDVQTEIVEYAVRLANGCPIDVLDVADPTHGKAYPEQTISTRTDDQIEIAVSNWEPWFTLPNLRYVRLLTGTGLHEMGEGSTVIRIAETLRFKYSFDGISVYHHGLIKSDGVAIDVAHHGPNAGKRYWLGGNVAKFYLQDIMMWEVARGERPPDLVLRGHRHQVVNVVTTLLTPKMNDYYESRLIVVPPLCMMSDHARKVTESKYLVTVGGVLFVIEDGVLSRPIFVMHTIDVRTEDVWKPDRI